MRTDIPRISNKMENVNIDGKWSNKGMKRWKDVWRSKLIREITLRQLICWLVTNFISPVKQSKLNELTSPFIPEPCHVSHKNGTTITAPRDDHKITRNWSFFKTMREACVPLPNSKDNENLVDENVDQPVFGDDENTIQNHVLSNKTNI